MEERPPCPPQTYRLSDAQHRVHREAEEFLALQVLREESQHVGLLPHHRHWLDDPVPHSYQGKGEPQN